VLAGVIGVLDTIPYVRDILSGSTRPHRGTWLIWGVLALVVCLSQRADGASWSLIMAGTQAVLTALIFLLAVSRGVGGLSRMDVVLTAVAGAGVAGWIVADAPIVATCCVVAADLIAAAMMLPKTYRDPESETLVTAQSLLIYQRRLTYAATAAPVGSSNLPATSVRMSSIA